jgi:hypothetical protein
MFVSDEFHVEKCVYLHTLRDPGCSDHSALSASLIAKLPSEGVCQVATWASSQPTTAYSTV